MKGHLWAKPLPTRHRRKSWPDRNVEFWRGASLFCWSHLTYLWARAFSHSHDLSLSSRKKAIVTVAVLDDPFSVGNVDTNLVLAGWNLEFSRHSDEFG